MNELKNKDYDQLLYLSVKTILSAWPLLRGVVDTKFNEGHKRRLRELKEYLSDPDIDFRLLKNHEIEELFVIELCKMIKEYKMKEEDIHDYIIIFMDEVFDAIPGEGDNADYIIASEIYQVTINCKNLNYEYIQQVIDKCNKFRNNTKLIKAADYEDSSSDENNDNSYEENKLTEEMENIKISKKKKKGQIEIDHRDLLGENEYIVNKSESEGEWY